MTGATRLPWWRVRFGFVVGLVGVMFAGWLLLGWAAGIEHNWNRLRFVNATETTTTSGEVGVHCREAGRYQAESFLIPGLRPGAHHDVRSRAHGEAECVIVVQWASGRTVRDTVLLYQDVSNEGPTLEIGQDSVWVEHP